MLTLNCQPNERGSCNSIHKFNRVEVRKWHFVILAVFWAGGGFSFERIPLKKAKRDGRRMARCTKPCKRIRA